MSKYLERISNWLTQSFVAGGVAPHTDTARFTYTVPTSYYATLTWSYLENHRDTVATTAGESIVYLTVTQPGETEVTWRKISLVANTVGASSISQVAHEILLEPGAVVKAYTADNSTGGTVTYRCCLHILVWR